MAEQFLEVQPREATGKNASRRLRRQGMVPAILYGERKDPVNIAVDLKALHRILHSEKGANTLFDLSLSGTERRRPAMVKDFQLDPLTDRLIHADFIRISADHEVHITVHVELEGLPIGVKMEGGLLEAITRQLTVVCLPKDIPSSIKADVSHLHLNQVMRVSDLQLPPGVRTTVDPTLTVCAVHAPAVEKAPTEAAAEAAPVEGATPAAATGKAEPAKEAAKEPTKEKGKDREKKG